MHRRLVLPAAALAPALGAPAALAGPLPGAATAGDRAAWRSILHWPGSCEAGWRATGTQGAGIALMSPVSTFRLAGDRFLPAGTRAKTACDGKPPYDPARWPRLATPKGA